MSERLCAVRKPGDPTMACKLRSGHGGSRRVGKRIVPVHDYAPTAEVLLRMQWDGKDDPTPFPMPPGPEQTHE